MKKIKPLNICRYRDAYTSACEAKKDFEGVYPICYYGEDGYKGCELYMPFFCRD